jgi:glyoxylase-like metal-dependent hydrolase (beta-lactamase superfamily II)
MSAAGDIIPIALPLDGRQAVNALLLTGEPLTLVDTGLLRPDSLAALEAGLARHGYAVADLAQLVITHAHLDHFGAAAALARASGARLLGDAGGAAAMARFEQDWEATHAYRLALFAAAGAPAELIADARRWGARYRVQGEPVALDVGLAEGDRVWMGGHDWVAVSVPGHAASSIALYDAARGLLLSGDILLGAGASNVTLHRVGDGRLPAGWQLTILDSLRRLAALPLRRVYPGHGRVIDDPAGVIAERIARAEARLAQVRGWLAERPLTAYEVSLRLYAPPVATSWVGLSAALGYVDALEARGEAAVEEAGGVRRYRPATVA